MKIKFTSVALFLILLIKTASAQECSSGDISKEARNSWLSSKIERLSGKTFVNQVSEKVNLERGATTFCNVARTIVLEKYSNASDEMSGSYSVKTSCSPYVNIHGEAIFEIKIKRIHYTDIDAYQGNFQWERLFTRGFNGVDDLKDEYESGKLCFLPGGRISVNDYVYRPQ